MSQPPPPLLTALFPLPRESVVAIGNFDGFHLGHRRIVERATQESVRRGLASVLLTFFPHPRIHLGHDLRLIQTEEQRRKSLGEIAVGHLFVLPFAEVVDWPAESFIAGVLGKTLRARVVVVGEDFRFGRGRQGDRDFLAGHAGACGLEVVTVPAVEVDGQRVSSSAIRHRLAAGDVAAAARMLGRPYEIAGTVVRGDGRGRTLGFPTLNLESENRLLPPGVFVSRTEIAGRSYDSVTHIGPVPTFHGEVRVETHLLDFNRPVYGERVRIHLLARLREVRAFSSAAALAEQIGADLAAARAFLRDGP